MILMRNVTQLLTVAAWLALTAQLSAQPATTSAPPRAQMAKQFQFTRTLSAKVNYLLFLPKGYDAKPGQHWPLILFLHGAGERGTDIWKVATHGPPKNVTAHPDFRGILSTADISATDRQSRQKPSIAWHSGLSTDRSRAS